MSLAKGFKIGILVSEFFKVVIELDGAADVSLGGGEVTSLGGVAAEVELNEGIFGVEACCVREDF